MNRNETIQAIRREGSVDVVILGAGVNGACLYDTLCRRGYRVLLLDKGDFAGGSSQASGMMVWGGLLYLRTLDLATVIRLCADRDRILADKGDWMAPGMMRYLPAARHGRSKAWVRCALWLYWLLGRGRRRAPSSAAHFREQALFKPGVVDGALNYEEAFLADSDARFVLRWIAPHRRAGQHRLNHCAVSGAYDSATRRWRLALRDTIGDQTLHIDSAMMVNCAGVWTDQVNAAFGIETPFRHVFSKGVYLTLPRQPEHEGSLFFELGQHGDVITHVPWGPVALWGPTETAVPSIAEGMRATRADVDQLLEQYARRYRRAASRRDIVALRCGIRPLVVARGYSAEVYPLDLSRRQEVVADRGRPWISCYGGKLTGCSRMAALAMTHIGRRVRPGAANAPAPAPAPPERPEPERQYARFPGLSAPVIGAAWSARHEMCATLDDYLRRRTNIAQWSPRGGLGENDCHAGQLQAIALELSDSDQAAARRMFLAYREKIERELDPLLRDD